MRVGPLLQKPQPPVRAAQTPAQGGPSLPQDGFEFSSQVISKGPNPLTQGVRFAPTQEEQLQSVLGFPLTHEGLTDLYGSCLPGSECFVTDLECGDNRFDYNVSWRDHEGRELAHASTSLAKHDDGSLELHRSDVFVVPECRGQAVNIKILKQEMALVRKASQHPDSRITLQAGSASVEGQRQRLGAYTWARYGFDFADAYPQGISKLCDYHCDCSESQDRQPDAELMRTQFGEWVDEHYAAPEQAEIAAALHKIGSHLRHPWELANLTLPGEKIAVRVGDQMVPCDVGKAFLVSDFCSNWSAVFRVNDPTFSGREVADQTYGKQIELATTKAEAERRQLLAQLDENPAVALQHLKARGDLAWIPILEMLPLRRPELRAQVEEVIDSIRGADLLAALKKRAKSGWDPSTDAVLSEQKARLDKGWTGCVCKIGPGGGNPSWCGRLKSWLSGWFGG